jgi:hypothetical protein
MGLHAERISEEEILLLEEEVLPAIGRFIEPAEAIFKAQERLRSQQVRLQPEVALRVTGPAERLALRGFSQECDSG